MAYPFFYENQQSWHGEPEEQDMTDFNETFKQFQFGQAEIPGFKAVDVQVVLSAIVGRHVTAVSGRAKAPYPSHDETRGRWGAFATYYFDRTQAGELTGTGWVLFKANSDTNRNEVFGGTFQICEHEIEDLPTSKPDIGKHDRRCTKCGTNLSYDSGD